MIVRSPRPTSHYTLLQNSVIRDLRLSWKARGLLVYLLSLPDNWKVSIEHLAKQSPQGRHSVTTALEELQQVGYVIREQVRDRNGRITWNTWVYDTPEAVNKPVNTTVDNHSTSAGFTATENRELRKKELKNAVVPYTDSDTYIGNPQACVCSTCQGTTWAPTPTGNLTHCTACIGGLTQ